jgi:hypothetical protein
MVGYVLGVALVVGYVALAVRLAVRLVRLDKRVTEIERCDSAAMKRHVEPGWRTDRRCPDGSRCANSAGPCETGLCLKTSFRRRCDHDGGGTMT